MCSDEDDEKSSDGYDFVDATPPKKRLKSLFRYLVSPVVIGSELSLFLDSRDMYIEMLSFRLMYCLSFVNVYFLSSFF